MTHLRKHLTTYVSKIEEQASQINKLRICFPCDARYFGENGKYYFSNIEKLKVDAESNKYQIYRLRQDPLSPRISSELRNYRTY